MPTYQTISDRMVKLLSELLHVEESLIDTSLQFDNYGLDSLNAAILIGELSDWLSVELDSSIVYDHPSIDQLSHFIINTIGKEER